MKIGPIRNFLATSLRLVKIDDEEKGFEQFIIFFFLWTDNTL